MSGRYTLPPRWLNCPRRSDLIADKFVAIKTPLDNNYSDKIKSSQLWTPSMALQSFKSKNVNIGLWIDLTNTSRFYNKEIVEKKVKYVKIECRGHGECPSEEQTRTFVDICHQFFCKEPLKKILVHCTHGFNRTGFLISAYLVERQDWSIEASVREFSKCRPPGIYKGDYLKTLFSRFGDVEDAPNPPELPDWCHEEEDAEDEVSDSGYSSSNSNKSESINRNATFMEGVPQVHPADYNIWVTIRRKCQDMCKWSGRGFPGSQPVSLDWKNIDLFNRKSYSVSWKADGTRYMMLIDGPDKIFFIDRDNSVFQAHNILFPRRKDPTAHLSNTLLDGEMIIDEHEGQKTPRYLIYDIVKFEGIDVGGTNFHTRRLCITKEIIKTRDEAKQSGIIDRAKEPFGIRIKEFWDIQQTKSLFGETFRKQLSHEIDGLIFQPYDDPYVAGQCRESLKWKPETHNSIDFKLKMMTIDKPGELRRKECFLYVTRMTEPYSSMPYSKALKDMDGKIIECTWDYSRRCWKFMRERTDKSFPNAYETANSVMESIRNPISKDKLLDIIDRILSFDRHQQHKQQSGQKRSYPSNSSDDRNLMPPPLQSGRGDGKRHKISHWISSDQMSSFDSHQYQNHQQYQQSDQSRSVNSNKEESFKFYPRTTNSVVFKLKMVILDITDRPLVRECYLFVSGKFEQYYSMPYSKALKDIDGKIIECTWDYSRRCWKFMQERTDKSFPDSYETVNSVMKKIRNPISKDDPLSYVSWIPSHH